MTTIQDEQLGELVLDGHAFRTSIVRGGCTVQFTVAIKDVDALAKPTNLLSVNLETMLDEALARVRSADDDCVGDYVDHQIDQLEPLELRRTLPEGSEVTADTVRANLKLRKIWCSHDESGLSLNLDHGLPEELTDYVIVVRIDANGTIEDVAMES